MVFNQTQLYSVQLQNITIKSLSEALLFVEHGENMLSTKNILNVSETISVQNMFSPGLSLEFSYIELVIQ